LVWCVVKVSVLVVSSMLCESARLLCLMLVLWCSSIGVLFSCVEVVCWSVVASLWVWRGLMCVLLLKIVNSVVG